MTSVITANNRAGRDNKTPAPELREDGTNFPYRMFYDGGAMIVDADTVGECVECLIPNYLNMSDEAKYDARVDYAQGVRQHLRVHILADLDPGSVEKWEWDVLSGAYEDDNGVGGDPYGWGDGSRKPFGDVDEDVIDVWSSKTPLVLLETSYQPFSDIPKPFSVEGDYEFVSNIIWLRPVDELSFLRSLSYANVISFGSPRAVALV